MMKRIGAVVATAFVVSSFLLLPVAPAAAGPLLRFDQANVSVAGTLSWLGGSNPLVGKDLVFQWVTGTDTAANDGARLDCNPTCLLNFTTGNYAGGGIWNPGGSFILTGDLLGIAESGNLITGTWTSPVTMLVDSIFAGLGADTKDAALLTYFGFSPDVRFTFRSTIITDPVPGGGGAFSVIVRNPDITNSPVPEPGTLLLLGGGLSALALQRRRKR